MSRSFSSAFLHNEKVNEPCGDRAGNVLEKYLGNLIWLPHLILFLYLLFPLHFRHLRSSDKTNPHAIFVCTPVWNQNIHYDDNWLHDKERINYLLTHNELHPDNTVQSHTSGCGMNNTVSNSGENSRFYFLPKIYLTICVWLYIYVLLQRVDQCIPPHRSQSKGKYSFSSRQLYLLSPQSYVNNNKFEQKAAISANGT